MLIIIAKIISQNRGKNIVINKYLIFTEQIIGKPNLLVICTA